MGMGKVGLKDKLGENLLTILTVVGVVAGIALGFILRAVKDDWTSREVMYVAFIGDLFLRMLRMLILPLIVSSLIAAVGSLDLSLSKRIGFRAIAYYLTTTVIAVTLGIILVTTINPGGSTNADEIDVEDGESANVTTADTLMDLVRNMVPPNLFQATMYNTKTELIYDPETSEGKSKNDWEFELIYADGTNILGLVVFSAILGVALGKLGERGVPLLNVFTSLSEATLMITHWVIWFSPVGVCFLIAGQLIDQDDLQELFKQTGLYFVTVMAGLAIHGFVFLPLMYGVITRSLPFKFMANMSSAMFTAFGTSSSSASLPITMECLEDKNHVDKRVSRFVLPIGATINMDGTALYEAVAAIWIAQMYGKELDAGNIIAISITSTAAAIGAAGIPQAGIVTMVMVLNTVGLPAEYVSYVIPVDWLLDRFRTLVNVFGDSIGAGIVNHLSKNDLEELAPLDDDSSSVTEANSEENIIKRKASKSHSLKSISFKP